MDWGTLITLAFKYGPTAYEYAQKYGPLAAKLLEAVAPVVQKAAEEMKDAPIVQKVNAVLKDIGHPALTGKQAQAVEALWADRASGAPGDGFAGFG